MCAAWVRRVAENAAQTLVQAAATRLALPGCPSCEPKLVCGLPNISLSCPTCGPPPVPAEYSLTLGAGILVALLGWLVGVLTAAVWSKGGGRLQGRSASPELGFRKRLQAAALQDGGYR